MSETTSIKISLETWQELNARKRSPSDTYDDVVARLVEESDCDSGAKEPIDA